MSWKLESDQRPYLYLPSLGFAMASAICYGSITTFASLSYHYGVQVEHLVLFRGLLVALLCLVWSITKNVELDIRTIGVGGALLLSFSLVLTSFCQLTAVRYISVSLTAVIFYVFPILVTLVETFSRTESRPLRTLALPLFAFIGVIIVVGADIERLDWRGLLLAKGAAVAMAVSILIAKRALVNSSVSGLALATNLGASVITLAYCWFSGQSPLPQYRESTVMGLLMIVAVGMLFAVGFIFQLFSIIRIGGSTTSMVLNFEPIVTLMAANMIIGETIAPSTVVGAIFITSAIFLCTRTTMRSSMNEEKSNANAKICTRYGKGKNI